MPADERLLHDILGLGSAAEHAVGDCEHSAAFALQRIACLLIRQTHGSTRLTRPPFGL
jgi:hypothetical protein